MRIKFQNPPINELVMGTYFNPPLANFRNEHVGLLWSKFRDEFPHVAQQPPIGDAEFMMALGGELFPMPRYWFIAEDQVSLLQVQKNAFLFNWRRRDAHDYPHFHENLKPTFDKYYSRFADFVASELDASPLAIDLCELTYINLIERCEYWSGPEDTPNVVPEFVVPRFGVQAASAPAFNCVYAFALAPDLQLTVTVRDARSTIKVDEPVLVIEIRAQGRLGQVSKSESDPWFDRAHDAVIDCFVRMTNPHIQQTYWKPVGGPA